MAPQPGVQAATWPTTVAAEITIHGQQDQSKLVNDPLVFYDVGHVGWHPLKETWAAALQPTAPPEPKTVGQICAEDCKEREKNRKRECAEIRKRVQQKLKEIGCPSSVKSTDKASVCPKRTVKKAVPTVKKTAKKAVKASK